MLIGIDQTIVFNSLENEKDLIQLECSYFHIDKYRNLFEIPLIIDSIQSIKKETIEVLPISRHEGADIRLIFHAGVSNEGGPIVTTDMDVFLILIYALGQLECFPPHVI